MNKSDSTIRVLNTIKGLLLVWLILFVLFIIFYAMAMIEFTSAARAFSNCSSVADAEFSSCYNRNR